MRVAIRCGWCRVFIKWGYNYTIGEESTGMCKKCAKEQAVLAQLAIATMPKWRKGVKK